MKAAKYFHPLAAVVVAAGAVLAAGCSSPSSEHEEQPMASTVTVEEAWANAADLGMAAVFGRFTNTGHHDAHMVSVSSPLSDWVEFHEVVGEGMENKTMQPKEGGITVPAGGSHELVPGGDHIMLMDLKRPLQPGEDVEVTVTFEDGSTLPVTAQIRDFPGAGEEYAGGGDTEAPHTNHG